MIYIVVVLTAFVIMSAAVFVVMCEMKIAFTKMVLENGKPVPFKRYNRWLIIIGMWLISVGLFEVALGGWISAFPLLLIGPLMIVLPRLIKYLHF